MKHFLIVLVALLTSYQTFAQHNIVTYLEIVDKENGAFSAGDLQPTDTIVDLKNGYYEILSNNLSIRQAVVFNNNDKSKTLTISTCSYDFVCYTYKLECYLITDTDGEITISPIKETSKLLIPEVTISDFTKYSRINAVAKIYLPKLQGGYLGTDAKIETLLEEFYDIKYIIPRYGTTIEVTLETCDYIPTNEIEITAADWNIINTDFKTIYLAYNKDKKVFELANQ